MATIPKKVVPFQRIIDALLDENIKFPPTYLHRFSDIGGEELAAVKDIWLQVKPARRLELMQELEDFIEIDTLVSFDTFAEFGLQDPDPAVRVVSTRMLWETQEDRLAAVFLNMLQNDSEETVRAVAASALGQFIYLGELEEFEPEMLASVEEQLLKTARGDEPVLVRRRALESLGFSSRSEVPDLIQASYDSNDSQWLSSALFAMGRSMDPRWEAAVMEMLHNPDSDVQLQAVRAAGQLDLALAREMLLEMLQDDELDEEVAKAAIWSLSQIGGEGVRERLEEILAAAEDEVEVEYLERALENLTFTEDFEIFDMFDFDSDSNELDDLLDDDQDKPTA